MISCRIHHIGHLLLFTLALLTLTPTLTSASVFGPDPIANSPAPALVARNLKPTKRQATGNPTTSQGFGRRSKKNVIPAAEKQKKDYSAFLCPAGSVSCPAISDGMRALDGRELRQLNAKEMNAQLNSLADWFKIGFECVQVESEMSNCGGCAQLGNGCVAIPCLHVCYPRAHHPLFVS